MSATSLVAPPQIPASNNNLGLQSQSYSSQTPEGQMQQLLNELYWQSLINATNGSAATGSRAIPNDPLLSSQWHLINSGQQVGSPDYQVIFGVPGEDLNVAPVWNQGIFGAGVSVAVIDSGVQLDHPDLAANIDLSRQYNANTRQPNGAPFNPANNPAGAHGTAVAGLIGAVANNGIGGAGVAPGVTLVPIQLTDGIQSAEAIVNALRFAIQNDIDITSNSFGPPDNVRTLAAPNAAELLALRDSVIFGRDGLGIINIWAAGNGAGNAYNRPGFPGLGPWDQSNYDGYANSRYTIAVTGVDHDGSYNNVDGTVTNYMEAGANVLVAAPTGSVFITVGIDTGTGSGLVTTDFSGENGFNQPPDIITGEDPDRDYLDDLDYTTRFNGTSASAPLVSGVVALMLEANPNLSWRDVQEILIRSARQNAQFEIPQNGAGVATQNTWITNQRPIFHDPDIFLPNIAVDPLLRTLSPTLDPNATVTLGSGYQGTFVGDHYVAKPFELTNGAGYTVSQGVGVYEETIGYGHGVVDAELAVQLAQQWSTKNQALPSELTFTTFVNAGGNVALNIPAAERTGPMASQNQIVPGGIGGAVGGGFIAYWNEYFDDDPFDDPNQTFPFRGQSSLPFSVPASNSMSIESVDVKLSITGDASQAMDHLRILLVSPSGTFSELNSFWYDDYADPNIIQHEFNGLTAAVGIEGTPGSTAPAGQFVWTFNTNRSWGERSDDALVINPVTMEPVLNNIGLGAGLGLGTALTQGWQLVIENWDANDAFGLQGVEIAWHGSPVAANSQRVQGFVGLDANRDDAFNYSRVIRSTVDLDADPSTVRLGEVFNSIDLAQEPFVANATVTVRRTSDNSLVDQFVTGADGNFYFDLVPDDYTITVEDTLGRAAQDDQTTPPGFQRHYKSEWQITADWFRAWDHDAANVQEVRVDANGVPVPWLDSNGDFVANGVRNINFLIDPGPVAPPQATFTGVVYADVNGDGVYNGDDVNLPNVTVFGDINRNGLRDPGEVTVLTDANGQYTLAVPVTQGTVLNVGVSTPTQWTKTSPTSGLQAFFVQTGTNIDDVDFGIKPPANNIGGGGANQPGILLGVVYDDANGNGSRQAGESGLAGVRVFIDANNNAVFDAGDTQYTTNEHGAYVFTNVAPGQRVVRAEIASPFALSQPTGNGAHVVNLTGSSTISNLAFGVRNTASLDFGDLPAQYNATLASDNGARHKKGAYWLGAQIDTELGLSPAMESAGADWDDLNGTDDDDGIVFDAIVPGSQARLVATASRNNGVLQGWVDWNNDGDFNDVGERVLTDQPLNAGANELFISVPAGANVAQVYARFRYGEHSLGFKAIGTPFGEALLGEVEDYRLSVTVPAAPLLQGLSADIDDDGDVDGGDFLSWQRNVGRTGANRATGDANGDRTVNTDDLDEITSDFGSRTGAAAAPPATGDFDGNSVVDGADFLAWQRGLALGHPSVAAGDGNRDGDVDGEDLAVWRQSQGSGAASSFSVTADAASSTAAASTSRSLSSIPAAADAAVADLAESAAERPAFRPQSLADLAARAGASGQGRTQRGSVVRDRFVAASTDQVDMAWDESDADVAAGDRGFEDLLGSRRRQGLEADAEAELVEIAAHCDEAFAAMSDGVDWLAE